MRRKIKIMQKKWRQQGAIIAFTALLLPMIIVGTGLAVDFGNIYVQYSRLQNAADAAALAGARAYAENNEKVDNHPNADAKAEKYIQGEFHNLKDEQSEKIVDNKNTDRYMAKPQNNVTYYRVKLYKEVPLYFLRGIIEKYTVSVESVAAIRMESEKNWFNNNMFIFRKAYHDTNSIENPDTLDTERFSKDKIRDTFDGRIVYTNGDGTNNPSFQPDVIRYSEQTDRLKKFYTSKAVTEEYDIKKLNSDENKAVFNSNKELISGYWSKAEYEVYDFDAFIKYMDEKTKDAPKVVKDQNLHLRDTSLFQNDILRIRHENSIPNIEVVIDSPLGNSDKPLYIYIEGGMGKVGITLNSDTGRPLIICMGGNKNQRSQVVFDINGHTFKGVLYAPYCNEWEGILTKSNGKRSTFIGTMVGEVLNLQNNDMHFVYHDYIGSKGTGSNGGHAADSSAPIHLLAPPADLKW